MEGTQEGDTIPVALEGKFEGWQATCRADPPWAFFRALVSGDVDRIGASLLGQVVSWNFRDQAGQPVPRTEEGLDLVPVGAVR